MSTVSTLAKNTIALFSAEVFSRGISIVYFAILARYIQIEGVGKISTAQALVYMLSLIINFGLQQLIIRDVAGSKARAIPYVSNVTFIRLLLSIIFLGVVLVITQLSSYSYELKVIIFIYSINAVLSVFTDIGYSIFQAFERMEFNLLIRIFRDSVNVGLSLLAIYLRYSLVTIVGISAFASLVELFFGFALLRTRFFAFRFEFDLQLCKRLLMAALPFAMVGLYPLTRSYLNTLILSATGSMEEVGRFAASNTIVMMLMLIPTILMQAMFPVFSRLTSYSDNSVAVAYQKSFNYLFLSGVAISVGTFLTAERIILLVLGPGFQLATAALRILAWLPLFGYVGQCNGNFLCATGREKLFMLTEGIFAIIYAISGFILTTRFGYKGACFAVLAPTVVGFFFYSILCHKLLHLYLPSKTAIMGTLASLVMAVCVHYSLEQGINLFIIVLLIGPAVYIGTLYFFKVVPSEDLMVLKRALRLS
jgi:O-antigen/teichoic acid export membrane protein